MRALRFALALALMGVMSLGGGFLAVVLLLDTDAAQAGAPADTVLRASALEIVDSDGVVRARIGTKGGDSLLALYDEKGTRRYRAVYERSRDRVSVYLADNTGDDRYLLSHTKEGESLLSFLGEKDAKLMTILAGEEQASSLLLMDPKSKRQVTVFAGRGNTTMQLADEAGQAGWLASVVQDGRSVMALAKDGKLRIRAMTGADTTPELVFLDDKRNKTWAAGK